MEFTCKTEAGERVRSEEYTVFWFQTEEGHKAPAFNEDKGPIIGEDPALVISSIRVLVSSLDGLSLRNESIERVGYEAFCEPGDERPD